MDGRTQSPALAIYSWVVVAATYALIFVGAMVTTKDVGLAVPDWPLSFGSLNPPGWWHMEGVNWEHGHRLMGAAVGLLVLGLCIAHWRAHRRSWLRWLGPVALVAVIAQGLMGGLRVTQISITWAVIHGCFAQAFFAFLICIGASNSTGVAGRFTACGTDALRSLRVAGALFIAAVFFQLVLGAVMRHHKAGLAIPDFPLAMGKIIPPIASFGVGIHFAHRVWALVVVISACFLVVVLLRHWSRRPAMFFAAQAIVVLVALQIVLGAMVIWYQRAEIPTSLHVLNGAAILGLGAFVFARAHLLVPSDRLLAGRPGKLDPLPEGSPA